MRPLVVPPTDMHAYSLARNVAQARIDGRHHALDEPEKIAHRPVLKRDVVLEREVGAVELKQKALICNRLIFDLERAADRGEIGVLGVVMFVADCRYHDARGGGRQECLLEPLFASSLAPIQYLAKIRAFAYGLGRADVADLTDRFRRCKIADHFPAGVLLLKGSLEDRIALD